MGYFKNAEIIEVEEGKKMKLYAARIGEFSFFTRGKSPAEARANINYRYFRKTGQWAGVDNIYIEEVDEILSKSEPFINLGNGQMEMAFGKNNEFLRFAERGTAEINLKEAII